MEDRRIRKTKKALYGALIELLKEKEIRNISIQELCDLADTHRSTFYYHYQDIYALYEEMEGKILEEFSAMVSKSVTHDYTRVYADVIGHVSENREVWSLLFSGHGSPNFRDKVSAILEEKYLDIWRYEEGRDTFPDEFYLLARANIAGFIALFVGWISDYQSLPAEKFERLLRLVDESHDELMEKCL